MNYYIGLFIMLSVFCSCNNSSKIEGNIEGMELDTIKMELDSMICFYNDFDYKCVDYKNAEFKMVYYIDLPECSSCMLMKKSEEWERLLDIVKPYQNRLVPFFILRPHAFDVDAFRFAVKVSATTVPIYVDTANVFIRNNSKLSAIPMLHTFVVDEQNRVVLIGDPLRNLEIQQLLVNLLKN